MKKYETFLYSAAGLAALSLARRPALRNVLVVVGLASVHTLRATMEACVGGACLVPLASHLL